MWRSWSRICPCTICASESLVWDPAKWSAWRSRSALAARGSLRSRAVSMNRRGPFSIRRSSSTSDAAANGPMPWIHTIGDCIACGNLKNVVTASAAFAGLTKSDISSTYLVESPPEGAVVAHFPWQSERQARICRRRSESRIVAKAGQIKVSTASRTVSYPCSLATALPSRRVNEYFSECAESTGIVSLRGHGDAALDRGSVWRAVCRVGGNGIFWLHLASEAFAGAYQVRGCEQATAAAPRSSQCEPGGSQRPHRGDRRKTRHDARRAVEGQEPGR